MIRLSYQPEEVRAKLRTLDREAIGEWEKSHNDTYNDPRINRKTKAGYRFPQYDQYCLCWVCEDAILGFDLKRTPTGYVRAEGTNTLIGRHVRICDDCLKQFRYQSFSTIGLPRHKPPSGFGQDLGDAFLPWAVRTLAYFSKGNWRFEKPEDTPPLKWAPPIWTCNIDPPEPFLYPPDHDSCLRFDSEKYGSEASPAWNAGWTLLIRIGPPPDTPKDSSFLRDFQQGYLDLCKRVLAETTPAHRKRWKEIVSGVKAGASPLEFPEAIPLRPEQPSGIDDSPKSIQGIELL